MNPYLINEPAVISLSGGRTSGYMLYKILEAHSGLPDHIKIVFANTGKEMPQTLDFVRDMGEEWGVPITWVEARIRTGGEGENKFVYTTVIVNHETASRDGRPFEELIVARKYLPNVMARFCTYELKIGRIKDFVRAAYQITDWIQVIGIRADEPRRAAKIKDEANELYYPLYHAGVTKEMVGEFWGEQNFDLHLPNNKGVTDWGNCDLCYLKGFRKRLSIIKQAPNLADWWIKQESRYTDSAGRGAYFRIQEPHYQDMKTIASDQGNLFDFEDDETIPCFCGD